ncbi:hypothetical protein ABZ816_28005 [Actinosynnema sp. NPDC047251]|uniref:Uncharacterized protein n=1 Tax=Saccharothrix espanaensis (strain ATCC 51144 / DSM 44229 / JCM 9112 / NBRC 15066 / NRRL 15764) TaxID=1179773 RepID=K0JPK3_SACES|nr:hypothetical protein [Saccharothrix espanaensis]CCH28850.1 hypothetical protein BN6_15260 [Saccharothrix espanaensis DSM 44229]
MGIWRRLFGSGAPEGFTGELAKDEHVLASAATGEGFLVATTLGLWLPGPRRLGWHLVSKASWSGSALSVVEAEEDGLAGEAVLLRDLPAVRYPLATPGKVPEVVHARVTGSIRSRHRNEDPGAWFLQRKVPGRDGVVLQVRPDPDADAARVREIAAETAAKIAALRVDS